MKQQLLVLALALAMSSCGGGGGGGGGGPQAPTNLFYAQNPAKYTQGFAVSNDATVTGTVDTWDVQPALPSGLSLDPLDGTISGTPLATVAPTLFTVTASNAKGEAQVAVAIEIVSPAPRALYVAHSGDGTVGSFQLGSLVHSGYALGSALGAQGLATLPDGSIVYLVSSAGLEITLLAVDPLSGRLSPAGTVLGTGSQTSSVAVDPTGSFLYTGNQGTDDVSVFTIGAGGSLSPGVPVGTGTDPAALLIDPTGQFLWVANAGSGDVEAFAIDPLSGALTSGGAASAGNTPSDLALATTPAGSFLYVSNSVDGTISQFSVEAVTGALTPLVPPSVATGLDPRDVAAHPDGTFLYCANRVDDTLGMYSIDQATGALSPLAPATVPAGNGPTGLAVDPRGTALYACTQIDNEVSEYAIGAGGGLTFVESVRTRSSPTDLLLGPAEKAFAVQSKHAYAAASSPANSVSQYSVAGAGFVALSPASVPTSTAPRGMAFDPDHELLIVTAETGTSFSLFQRNPATGLLASAGSEAVASTADVAFEPSGRFAYATVRITGVQPFAVDYGTPDLSPLTLVGAGVDPRSMAVDPTGRFLYVAETTQGVFQFVIDPVTGELTAAGSAPGAGTTVSVAVHPSGRYAYASNVAGDSISMYALDSVSGTLATLAPPAISTGAGTDPTGMDFDPSGAHLYVAFAGQMQVAHYTVDKATGMLTFESTASTFAQVPQALAVNAAGTVLACTNSGSSGVVTLFSLNPTTGAPVGSGFAAAGPGPPTGIVFSRDIQ